MRPLARRVAEGAQLRLMLVALVALALALQGYLAGSHSHAKPASYAAATAGKPVVVEAPQHGRGPAGTPDSCPICQGMALAAALLPVIAARLQAPMPVAAWYSLTRSWQLLRQQRSHAWHSRGPPADSDDPR